MNKHLDDAVVRGDIVSYTVEDLNEEGEPGQTAFRNTQRLTITLLSGRKLICSTWCSGVRENTGFHFGE